MLGIAVRCFYKLVLAWGEGTSCVAMGCWTVTLVGEREATSLPRLRPRRVAEVPFWGQVRVGYLQAGGIASLKGAPDLRDTSAIRGGVTG
jgi:hypothetical protein